MSIEIILSLVAALSSVLVATLSEGFLRVLLPKSFGREKPRVSYKERLIELTTGLTKASNEVNNVLAELTKVAKDRERAVSAMETSLTLLESREKELKDKIEVLQNIPIPVAEQFAKLVAPGEKRSSKRDYFLFIAGVAVTTIITIILQAFSKR